MEFLELAETLAQRTHLHAPLEHLELVVSHQVVADQALRHIALHYLHLSVELLLEHALRTDLVIHAQELEQQFLESRHANDGVVVGE